MAPITPFKIAVPESKLQRLKEKLALAEFPDEVDDGDDAWQRGPPLADIKRLSKYWADGYDWRKAESKLNEIPQFTTKIEVDGFEDEFDIHFLHQQSSVKNAIPLLFVHGWPGNFLEATKILPQLVQGGADMPAFHVVAPSLVNFGFSSPCLKGKFQTDHHAEVCHKLMQALGYKEYVSQGGDLGWAVTRLLAIKYPESVKAHLVNMAIPAEPTLAAHPALYAQVQATPLSESDKAGLERSQQFRHVGTAYYKMQATRPQLVSYVLASNPVALLAWVYDKLHAWTDNYPWTDDEVLTWISIYEFATGGPWASVRIYYDNEFRQGADAFGAAQTYTESKIGISRFPREIVLMPKLWHGTLGPVVQFVEHEAGGHFAAWERPDDLVADLRKMFSKDGGGAFGCIDGRSGYDDLKEKL